MHQRGCATLVLLCKPFWKVRNGLCVPLHNKIHQLTIGDCDYPYFVDTVRFFTRPKSYHTVERWPSVYMYIPISPHLDILIREWMVLNERVKRPNSTQRDEPCDWPASCHPRGTVNQTVFYLVRPNQKAPMSNYIFFFVFCFKGHFVLAIINHRTFSIHCELLLKVVYNRPSGKLLTLSRSRGLL